MLAIAASAAATSALAWSSATVKVAVVDPGQHLAGLDRLVVADQHLAQIAGDLRRDRRVVGLHIGVVGRDLEPADRPVVPAEIAGAGQSRRACRPASKRPAQRKSRGQRVLRVSRSSAQGAAQRGRRFVDGDGPVGCELSWMLTHRRSSSSPGLPGTPAQFGNLSVSKIDGISRLSREFGKRLWSKFMRRGAAACRGRPQVRSDEETRALILEAAGQEFQANGYEATCIADVAERAGVSTKTLYRLIPTKADLFANVIAERIGRFVLEYDLSRLDSLDAAAALERMLTVFGTLTLEPRTIALTRLVLGDSRLPGSRGHVLRNAIQRTSEAMEDGLRRLCARGLIALDDPAEAVEHAARHDDHGAAARGHARPAGAAEHGGDRRPRQTLRADVPERLRKWPDGLTWLV